MNLKLFLLILISVQASQAARAMTQNSWIGRRDIKKRIDGKSAFRVLSSPVRYFINYVRLLYNEKI